MNDLAGNLLVALIVAAGVAYATWSLWLRGRWRARRARAALAAGLPAPASGGDCGCSGCDAAPPAASPGRPRPGAW